MSAKLKEDVLILVSTGIGKLTIRNATATQKKAIEEIAPWVLQHLVGKKLAKNIELNIKMKKDYRKKEGLEGSTYWEDDNHNPREFTIEIDKSLKTEHFIQTLCHELVHVKQYATGEMKDIFKGPFNLLWRGERIDTKRLGMNYWDQPWEIEAFGREDGLYIMWKESKNLKIHETFGKYLKSLSHNP